MLNQNSTFIGPFFSCLDLNNKENFNFLANKFDKILIPWNGDQNSFKDHFWIPINENFIFNSKVVKILHEIVLSSDKKKFEKFFKKEMKILEKYYNQVYIDFGIIQF